MKKQLNAIFLLAGTAIGSGMFSLPIILAKFGIINSCIIILVFALLTYITAIIRAELNLNSQSESTLKEVGIIFNCPKIGFIGDWFLKILSFALISAYISGGTSIINAFFNNIFSHTFVLIIFTILIAITFFFYSNKIVHINKILFIGMFSALMILTSMLLLKTNIRIVPNKISNIHFQEWTTLIPIIFTSFGFQGSIHSMTKLCNNDISLIKKACFWGSIIPAFVYIIWTSSVLFVVCNTDIHFFQLMLEGNKIDIGKLINVLSCSISMKCVQNSVWIVSILAIITSIVGVVLALLDIFQREWNMNKLKSICLITIIPAFIALFVPNAFIRILNISGIILSFIAIIVPIIISWKMQTIKKCNLIITSRFITITVFICGILIILLGILDIRTI
ncbi:MAG: hypothetical protein IJ730_02285 [Alphaproteobacteria bacterium]|nr:hypothetical protein [Alphaproteobacteria bacterium]